MYALSSTIIAKTPFFAKILFDILFVCTSTDIVLVSSPCAVSAPRLKNVKILN